MNVRQSFALDTPPYSIKVTPRADTYLRRLLSLCTTIRTELFIPRETKLAVRHLGRRRRTIRHLVRAVRRRPLKTVHRARPLYMTTTSTCSSHQPIIPRLARYPNPQPRTHYPSQPALPTRLRQRPFRLPSRRIHICQRRGCKR